MGTDERPPENGAEATGEATVLLRRFAGGDRRALDELLPLVERELHDRAERLMRRERAAHTLQPTALVNEAYIKLVDQRAVSCRDRSHFVAIAVKKMREILANHARDRRAHKRGGDRERMPLLDGDITGVELGADHIVDAIALDEALARLEAEDAALARVVSLRLFGGLTYAEIAEVTGVSLRTIKRDIKAATMLLLDDLRPPDTRAE